MVIDVITKFFSANTFTGNIAGALGVITSILTVVCYILYLGLLKKAKRMLEAA